MFRTKGFKKGDYVFYKGTLHKVIDDSGGTFRLIRMADGNERTIIWGGQIYNFREDTRGFVIPDEMGDAIFENDLFEFSDDRYVENDGIGDYEYWGNKEYDKGTNHFSGEVTGKLPLGGFTLRQLVYYFLTDGYDGIESVFTEYIQEQYSGDDDCHIESQFPPSFDWNETEQVLEITFGIGGLA